MKKFLGKKVTMISFVVVAVVLAVFYIGMLVRPVAIGFTYKGEIAYGLNDTMDMTVKVNSGSEVDVTLKYPDQSKDELENVRYVEHDGEIYLLMDYFTMQPEKLTDKQYKERKKEILRNWDTYEEAAFDINAFEIEMDDDEDTLTCVGSIVFAVIGGVVLTALGTLGALSVYYYVKDKKQS